MYSLLSVLVTKEPSTCVINLYHANPKTVKNVLTTKIRGCGAFVECIADLDNAHFISKFDMWSLCGKLTGSILTGIPVDRLVAAKKLSTVLATKQKELPEADTLPELPPSKCFMPLETINPPKEGTKAALQLRLLARGTTVTEMMEVLGWKEGSVQSGLNYDLNHVRGFGYRIEKQPIGEDIYSLIIPDWYKGPLVLPSKKKLSVELEKPMCPVPSLEIHEPQLQYA